MSAPSRGRYTAVALAFSFLWASAFIAMKIALRDSPPLLLMCSRYFIAGTAMLLLARARGAVLPAGWRGWRQIAVLGVLTCGIYFGLTSIAIRALSAGLAATLASTNPVALALVAPWALGEKLTPVRAGGIALSFGGVAWMMASRVGADNAPWAMALFLGCVMFMVAGTVLFKRWQPPYDRLVVNSGQLLAGGLFLLVPMAVTERVAEVRLTVSLVAAQLYLIVVVAGVVLMLWLWLLDHGGATRATAFLFLNPLWGLLLAALLLGEPLGAADVTGGLAVALGVWMVQRP